MANKLIRHYGCGHLHFITVGDGALLRFWQRRFYDFNVWSLKKRV